ncbi:MAG: pyridoxal-phosphate dependent enzyme [Chloroflexota bacterium]
MALHFDVECLDCGHRAPFHPTSLECPRCGSHWREARYDLASLGRSLPSIIARRPFDLWRYLEVLPVRVVPPTLPMGEGGTPLFPARNLGAMLGLPHVYVKDERQSPTASFKDRQAALSVAVLKEAGLTEAVVASTGNVAMSYAAYCARAGIHLWAFLTSLVPAEKMHEVAIYGTQVIKVTGTYDQAKRLAAEFAQQRGLYLDRGTRSIAAVESMKTMAYEMAEQLGALASPAPRGTRPVTAWRAPDWYIQAVSGGIGPMGILKGFEELVALELVPRVPAIAGIQTAGCAPMAEAWRRGAASVAPVEKPRTHIATLSTGDPGRTYTLLRQRLLEGPGGVFESVSDEDAFRAMHIVAKTEGISLEPAAAVAFAGLIKLTRSGVITPDQVVVVNCSGHTMPVEESLLREGWAQDVSFPEGLTRETPQEGLLAALAELDQDRVHRILVVDDDAGTRRLLRRILQAQGEFTILEAGSGDEALAEARRTPPHLIVLDLMMPEMDGFAVLDHLRQQPETASVPIIVVTAMDLSPAEKKQLEGQIARLITKGDYLDEDLLHEISRVLD